MRLRHFSAALLTIAALGCAGAKPYQANLNSPVLEPRDSPQMEKNGVIIAVDPIARENLQQFPEVARIASWREADPGAQHYIGATGGVSNTSQMQMVERSAVIAFVPLPAFRLRMANNTGQPVTFPAGRVQLEDNLHRQYPAIVDTLTLRGRFTREMIGTNTHIANDQGLMRVFTNGIDQIPLLSPSVTIPPGGKWNGYAVFEVGAIGEEEYNALMSSVQSFMLRLQSSVGGSNGPEFAFNLDKQTKAVAVTCPPEAKVPSLDKCSRNDATPVIGSGLTRPEGQR
jgi:hypothetical protein